MYPSIELPKDLRIKIEYKGLSVKLDARLSISASPETGAAAASLEIAESSLRFTRLYPYYDLGGGFCPPSFIFDKAVPSVFETFGLSSRSLNEVFIDTKGLNKSTDPALIDGLFQHPAIWYWMGFDMFFIIYDRVAK